MPGFSKPLSPRGEIKRCMNSQLLPDLFQPLFSPAPCLPPTPGCCLGNYLRLPCAELISSAGAPCPAGTPSARGAHGGLLPH